MGPVVFSIILFVTFCGSQAVAAVRFGDVAVSVEGGPQFEMAHGYMAHLLRIENDSSTRSHTVEVVQQAFARRGTGVRLGRLSRTTAVGPGSTVRVMLPAPAIPMPAPNAFDVFIDGELQQPTVTMPYASPSAAGYGLIGGQPRPILFLASRQIDRDRLNTAFMSLHASENSQEEKKVLSVYRGKGSGQEAPTMLRAEAPIDEWSEHWLAYTCYDALVLTGSELSRAPAAVAEAIWSYAECGGVLLLTGTADIPEPWKSLPAEAPGPLCAYRTGFGWSLVYPDAALADAPKAVLRHVEREVRAHERVWPVVLDLNRAHGDFPVVAEISIPTGTIFVIMLLFAILAGPVNVLLLARFDRRIWLYWTVPALAGVTTLGIVCTMLFSEGITPVIRVSGITLLDQVSQKATTLATNAFYCPLSPRDGLHYGYDTEVTPRAFATNQEYVSLPPRDLDWTTHQHLYSGWVQPRIPAYLALRQSEHRQERLHIRRADRYLSIVNGLGTAVKRVLIADTDGRLYEALDIPAGAQATASPTQAVVAKGASRYDPAATYRSSVWNADSSSFRDAPGECLQPGTYIAFLDGAPFVENGLHRAGTLTASSIVYGFYAGGEGGNE